MPRASALVGLSAFLSGCTAVAPPLGVARTALEQTLGVHTGAVTSIDFSPDGSRLVSSGRDGKIVLLDWKSRRVLAVLPGRTEARVPVLFGVRGERLFVGGGKPKVYAIRTRKQIARLSGHSWVYDLARSSDGRLLATAGGDDQTIGIWDPKTLARKALLRGHQGKVYAVAFAPGGAALASGGQDRTIRIWSAVRGFREIRTVSRHTAAVIALAYRPTGGALGSVSSNGGLLFLDVNSYVPHGRPPVRGNVTAIAYSPDGRLLAVAVRGEGILMFDQRTEQGPPERIYESRGGTVRAIAFHPTGSYLVAGSSDGAIRVWKVRGVER